MTIQSTGAAVALRTGAAAPEPDAITSYVVDGRDLENSRFRAAAALAGCRRRVLRKHAHRSKRGSWVLAHGEIRCAGAQSARERLAACAEPHRSSVNQGEILALDLGRAGGAVGTYFGRCRSGSRPEGCASIDLSQSRAFRFLASRVN